MTHGTKGVNWHLLAIVCLAYAFFFVGIDRAPVPTVDGVVRASMARNVVETGQLWPIMYEGRVFADHPPLFIWLTALSYEIFGVTDFAANFVPRLFAFLTVVITALIALEVGLSRGVALLAAFILCLTRDFVLSSVRGYIEPVLEVFIYSTVLFSFRYVRTRLISQACIAGVAVWLAAYSKGPVALWPFLFCAYLLRKPRALLGYGGAFAACTITWATWVTLSDHWPYWARYWNEQVLGSALKGRGGAQQFEPFYFVQILAKYYWPWLPFFLWAAYRAIRSVFASRSALRKQLKSPGFPQLMLLLALGFIGGFSVMKWKFWYYIAPAYPAMALLIAASLRDLNKQWFEKPVLPKYVATAAAIWIVFASIVPVELHRERVPEVMAFKDTIRNSPVQGPVWFVRSPRDHNMIGTSGEWYFRRIVKKVENETSWERKDLRAPAWIITSKETVASCQTNWCKQAKLIQVAGESALLYYSR